ncbi:MAG: V-type ATP synthase subunit D [Candidatus Omnitrophica bacterium]|nr:V-type ATP synthase subunit D [Candidatus Omnitrophota bacterium]
MAKIKFTKGELKRQRDSLKQFEHYLPILQLKKQQLQIEIQHVHERLDLKLNEISSSKAAISIWAGLLNEGQKDIVAWITPKEIITKKFNIAGVDIPLFVRVNFADSEYDLFLTPLWVDIAIEKIRQLVVLYEQEKIFRSQLEILEHELRLTAQRVNLFEKVKIPEARENVRIIKIYLGDQQTNAVGRSKIAKKKTESLVLEEAVL